MTPLFGTNSDSGSDDILKALNMQNVDILAIRRECSINIARKILKTDLSTELIIEFMDFIRRPDIDSEIDALADRNQGHGPLSPYKQAKIDAAVKHFSGDKNPIPALVEFEEKMYELSKGSDFQEMVDREILERTQSTIGLEEKNGQGSAQETLFVKAELTTILDGQGHLSKDQERELYIESMQDMHFESLDENDRGVYFMILVECREGLRNRSDLESFWKARLR